MWSAREARRSRKYTVALLDALEQGLFDKDALIADLLNWMSENDVEQFVRFCDLLSVEEEDEEEVS